MATETRLTRRFLRWRSRRARRASSRRCPSRRRRARRRVRAHARGDSPRGRGGARRGGGAHPGDAPGRRARLETCSSAPSAGTRGRRRPSRTLRDLPTSTRTTTRPSESHENPGLRAGRAARRETGYRRDRRLLRQVSRTGSPAPIIPRVLTRSLPALRLTPRFGGRRRVFRGPAPVRAQASARAHASRGAAGAALEEAASLGLVIPAALAEAAAALQRHARANAAAAPTLQASARAHLAARYSQSARDAFRDALNDFLQLRGEGPGASGTSGAGPARVVARAALGEAGVGGDRAALASLSAEARDAVLKIQAVRGGSSTRIISGAAPDERWRPSAPRSPPLLGGGSGRSSPCRPRRGRTPAPERRREDSSGDSSVGGGRRRGGGIRRAPPAAEDLRDASSDPPSASAPRRSPRRDARRDACVGANAAGERQEPRRADRWRGGFFRRRVRRRACRGASSRKSRGLARRPRTRLCRRLGSFPRWPPSTPRTRRRW